jgi:hypothetical protein
MGPLYRALGGEVEVIERLHRGKARPLDPALSAVGLELAATESIALGAQDHRQNTVLSKGLRDGDIDRWCASFWPRCSLERTPFGLRPFEPLILFRTRISSAISSAVTSCREGFRFGVSRQEPTSYRR